MHIKKPDWLKIKIQTGKNYHTVKELLCRLSLHTVCQEADCPNLMECFCNKTATFMILGNICTRNCTFCGVTKGCPEVTDPDEPKHIAQAVKELKLRHVVITSVTRDDLYDGGAGYYAATINQIRSLCPEVTIEVLIPDFKGDQSALDKVIQAKPQVINHNIETVPRLYPEVRPMADYVRSLELLKYVKKTAPDIKTKSGMMVGLGETFQEVTACMHDLRIAGCDFLTIGQYLAPTKNHHPVIEYIHPEIFEEYKNKALDMGFLHVSSGPFVRSSYHAENAL